MIILTWKEGLILQELVTKIEFRTTLVFGTILLTFRGTRIADHNNNN